MVFFIMLLIWLFSFIVHVTVMIYGWGIEPQNWLVIGGGYVFTVTILSVGEFIKRANK